MLLLRESLLLVIKDTFKKGNEINPMENRKKKLCLIYEVCYLVFTSSS